jgi:hypothetical protein
MKLKNYVLQATNDFLTWMLVTTNIALTNLFNLVDLKTINFSNRFYRV